MIARFCVLPLILILTACIHARHITGEYHSSQSEFNLVKWTLDEDDKSISVAVTRSLPSTSFANGSDALISGQERWFAVGWSHVHVGMSDTDMIFFWDSLNASSCSISDRHSNGPHEPPKDDHQDVEFVSYQIDRPTPNSNDKFVSLTCTVKRALITDDPRDEQLVPGMMKMGFAYGSFLSDGVSLAKHPKGTVRTFDVDLFRPFYFNDVAGAESTRRWQSIFFWHGFFMIVAWCLLMLPGMWLARYFKVQMPKWFTYHWRIQAVAFVFMLVGFVLAWVALSGRIDTSPHGLIGFTVVFAMTAQVVLGYLSNALWFEGKPPHWYPDKMHWWLGRLAGILGLVNLFFGIDAFDEKFGLHSSAAWFMMACVTILGVIAPSLFFELFMGQKHEHEQYQQQQQLVSDEEDAEAEGRPSTSAELLISPDGRRIKGMRFSAQTYRWVLISSIIVLGIFSFGFLLSLIYG